ncbi:hypothetical protein N1851_029725 [Merluccius polli]|uniref:SCAN box domain-containing protein n=1 Tax=Merluccius polli TaxID=89951 RepID=A0AA47M700_MERPO|nr:hypothetical protein N1851_029725 [Merluccius polli]
MGRVAKQILAGDSEVKEGDEFEKRSEESEEVKLKELDVKLELEHMQLQQTIRLRELEIEELRIRSTQQSMSKEFDLARNSRLVPPFNEKEVEEYFTLFERVADALKWPEEFRPLLLQTVLVGKAQSVYASLSVAQSSNYKTVKEAILRTYELVPEAYRQQFHKLRKSESQTHGVFAREQQILFERWCKSQDIKDLEG